MAKNAKKTNAVMIMIMIIVGFVQANCNPQFASTESNNVPDKIGARGPTTYAVDSCAQECNNKNVENKDFYQKN
ncbi:hypothetical protein CR513_13006, partial [Mucuna pruriens]